MWFRHGLSDSADCCVDRNRQDFELLTIFRKTDKPRAIMLEPGNAGMYNNRKKFCSDPMHIRVDA